MACISASLVAKVPVVTKPVAAFKPAKAGKAAFVSNGSIKKTSAFMVWQPRDNKVSSSYARVEDPRCVGDSQVSCLMSVPPIEPSLLDKSV